MAKAKISPTPLRQVYFGQKPILIEKNWKAWLKDPAKLEANLKFWFAENARVVDENNSLKEKLSDKDLEITNLKNGFKAERTNWTNEKTNLENQVKLVSNSRDTYLKQLTDSREFAKKTYVWLGNYGSNPILQNLGQLKWLLRKHDKPTTDADYYTLYDLVRGEKWAKDKKNLEKDVASWKSVYELEKDKVKNLSTDKTNLTNEKNQLTIERDNLRKDKQIKELQLTNKDNQINTLNNQITKKDNRIAQLDQTVKDSALIFQTQINIIDQLTTKLEAEKAKNTGNAEYQSHLQTDIIRLVKERKDLVKQKKDLEDVEAKNKALRDKEISDLKTERDARAPNTILSIADWNNDYSRRAKSTLPNGTYITQTQWDTDYSLRPTLAQYKADTLTNEESMILEVFRKYGSNKQQSKTELENKGYGSSVLGNKPYPKLGYHAYYYLYS